MALTSEEIHRRLGEFATRWITYAGSERAEAQTFLNQLLECFDTDRQQAGARFEERGGGGFMDIVDGLLDHADRSSADDLGGLFERLNTPGARPEHGLYAGAPYADGGLFESPAHVHLEPDEVELLREACRSNWKLVEPSIFGNLLEGALGRERVWAFGAHYTSEADIRKVVEPTIVEPWRERIDACSTLAELAEAHRAFGSYAILDPACGSGNFLYIAYRELRRIEAKLRAKERELRREAGLPEGPSQTPAYPLSNVHGIELEPGFILDGTDVPGITASLLATGDDVTGAGRLVLNRGKAFQGPMAVGKGFILSVEEAESLLQRAEADYRDVVRPFLVGDDIAEDPGQRARRFVIDLGLRTLEDARLYPAALEILRDRVKRERETNPDRFRREKWWLLGRPVVALRYALRPLPRYIAGTRLGSASSSAGAIRGRARVTRSMHSPSTTTTPSESCFRASITSGRAHSRQRFEWTFGTHRLRHSGRFRGRSRLMGSETRLPNCHRPLSPVGRRSASNDRSG